MIIDDDCEDQMILQSVVEDTGAPFNYILMDNAEKALDSLASNTLKPDYIFLDLNLPLMDGFECLLLIKKEKSLKKIPVIIYSTSSREKDILKAKEFGAFEYLQKPSNYRELKFKVGNLLATLP